MFIILFTSTSTVHEYLVCVVLEVTKMGLKLFESFSYLVLRTSLMKAWIVYLSDTYHFAKCLSYDYDSKDFVL